jgi:DNA polymerase
MSCGKVDPRCSKCRLSKDRTRVVPGVGPRSSKIVFIGEAPGKDEDSKGEPFVGRAGKILDVALESAGVSRQHVRITNLVKCRPPQNRRPRRDEISKCRELYLDSELEEIAPDVVCALGQTVAQQFLKTTSRMSKAVGMETEIHIAGKPTKLIIAYHPAACLYQRKNLVKFNQSIKKALGAAGVI